MQKIYFNNKPILLVSHTLLHDVPKSYTILEGAKSNNFTTALNLLSSNIDGVAIVDDEATLLKELLWSFYSLHSAGGVVLNENNELLMIYRRGKWDLPKGKQDDGEHIETCAIREVKEETGLVNVSLEKKITNTMHIYPMSGNYILKHTAWYEMSSTSKEILIAQKEEQIEKVVWVNKKEIPQLLANSFKTISDVLKIAKLI